MKTLFLTIMAFLLVSCASNDQKTEPAKVATPTTQQVHDCVFPETDEPAPGWICDEPVPGVAVSAVGVSEFSKAGTGFMKDIAMANARGQLAEQMKVQVQKMIKSYLGTTGVGDEQTYDTVASTTTKTITNESLIGSRIFKSRVGPNKKYYALVGLDPDSIKSIAERSSLTSMNNDRALWQEFKANQSFEEMAKDIASQDL